MWPELLNTMAAISKGILFLLIAGGPGVELLIAFEIALIVLQSVMP